MTFFAYMKLMLLVTHCNKITYQFLKNVFLALSVCGYLLSEVTREEEQKKAA